MDIQASVSVGHENLRAGEAFDKPHPTPEVLLTSTASSCHQRDDRVHLGPSPLMPWCPGALVPWCLGALVPWCLGAWWLRAFVPSCPSCLPALTPQATRARSARR